MIIRLEKEFGEQVADQRGWHWALTSFALHAWGKTHKEGIKYEKFCK
jgi:hypothetical protein